MGKTETTGWRTTNDEEIERRRRGPPRSRSTSRRSNETTRSSASSASARVRGSLDTQDNSCGCPAEVAAGRKLDVVKLPFYPYQREGTLHLAFTERALLADEMGLGKTVQAVAACALLKELRGVERVLVVSPASLKAEWGEQIARFTDLPSRLLFGTRTRAAAAVRGRRCSRSSTGRLPEGGGTRRPAECLKVETEKTVLLGGRKCFSLAEAVLAPGSPLE